MPFSAGIRPAAGAVPVLCYHAVGGNGVPVSVFREQLAWLFAMGVETLGIKEFKAFLHGGVRARPGVLLTFDDGFRDLYTTVAPLFEEFSMQGVAFVIGNRIRPDDEPGSDEPVHSDRAHEAFVRRNDRSAWLSDAEIRHLVSSGLFDIGSHGSGHVMAPAAAPGSGKRPDHWAYANQPREAWTPMAPELGGPAWVSEEGRLESEAEFYERVRREVSESFARLERVAGVAVDTLAWPWGARHPVGIKAARDAGASLCFSLRRGPAKPGTDPSDVPRLEIRSSKGLGWFASRVNIYSRPRLAAVYSAARI